MNTAALKRLFTPQTPFGPHMANMKDSELFDEFYYESDAFTQALSWNMRLILGRRGCGKSSVIGRILTGSEFDEKIVFKQAKCMHFLTKFCSSNSITLNDLPVEQIYNLWRNLYWLILISHFWGKTERTADILFAEPTEARKRVFQHFSFKRGESATTDLLANDYLAMREYFSSESFVRDVKAACQALGSKTAVICLDNDEQTKINNEVARSLLAGLLHSLTEFSEETSNVVIKCFFPSEISSILEEVCDNWGKLAPCKMIMRWEQNELLIVLCKRLQLYLHLCGKEKDFDVDTVRKAKSVWAKHFSSTVWNDHFRTEEDSKTYVFRHSQLLPRQVVTICNLIAQGSSADIGREVFTNEDIRKGVRLAQPEICKEIFSTYTHVYPQSFELSRQYLGEINIRVSYGELDALQNKIDLLRYPRYRQNMQYFVRMLLSLGLIGVGKHPEEYKALKYYDVDFEYFFPSEINFNSQTIFYVHPAFIEYLAVKASLINCGRPIRPHGVEIEEPPPEGPP